MGAVYSSIKSIIHARRVSRALSKTDWQERALAIHLGRKDQEQKFKTRDPHLSVFARNGRFIFDYMLKTILPILPSQERWDEMNVMDVGPGENNTSATAEPWELLGAFMSQGISPRITIIDRHEYSRELFWQNPMLRFSPEDPVAYQSRETRTFCLAYATWLSKQLDCPLAELARRHIHAEFSKKYKSLGNKTSFDWMDVVYQMELPFWQFKDRFYFISTDIVTWGPPDQEREKYKFITAFNVFHYFKHTMVMALALKNILTSLKSGGVVALSKDDQKMDVFTKVSIQERLGYRLVNPQPGTTCRTLNIGKKPLGYLVLQKV